MDCESSTSSVYCAPDLFIIHVMPDTNFETSPERAEFIAAALKSREEFERTRMGYCAEEVFAYLEARNRGLDAPKPPLRHWPKAD